MGRGYIFFFFGCLLQLLFSKLNEISKKIVGMISILVNVGLLGITLIHGSDVWTDFRLLLTVGIFPTLILAFACFDSFIPQGIEQLCKKAGRLSMVIYFIHFPVQYMIHLFDVGIGLDLNYSSNYVFVTYVLLVNIFAVIYIKTSDKLKCIVKNHVNLRRT